MPDVAASVTAFCLKHYIPLTCHQAGTTTETPVSMVRDVVRFVDVMRAVEMRKFHLLDLLCGVVPFTVYSIACTHSDIKHVHMLSLFCIEYTHSICSIRECVHSSLCAV